MADLTVIVPSRSRPESVSPLAAAFRATCTADTRLLFVVDNSDPRQQEYIDAAFASSASIMVRDSASMVEALNRAATSYEPGSFATGFMGDDHCPRTHGWDERYLETLRELGTGMVYGDDLLQRDKLPTQIAMTSDIVRGLGYMAPPELVHLYVDNFWLDLGRAVGRIRYLPGVVVEHRHPVAGKAQWDEGYARVNDGAVYQRDRVAYEGYHADRFAADVQKVEALRG